MTIAPARIAKPTTAITNNARLGGGASGGVTCLTRFAGFSSDSGGVAAAGALSSVLNFRVGLGVTVSGRRGAGEALVAACWVENWSSSGLLAIPRYSAYMRKKLF